MISAATTTTGSRAGVDISGKTESCLMPGAEVRLIDPLAGPEWDELVLSHPDANFFHASAWARVLSKSYNHKPSYLYFSSGGKPLACVPMMEVSSFFTGRRGVCLPFSDFCGPLLFNDCEPSLIMNELSMLARKRNWKRFEIRDGCNLRLGSEPTVEYWGHTLDLRHNVKGLLASFSGSVRRAIKNAEASKLAVEISDSLESVTEFYRLHVRTRRRHGVPPQPFSFFLNIYHEIIRKGLGFVVLASLGTRYLASAIFFQFGRKALYKFGASEPKSLRVRGNNLVMWEGIRHLARSGCESLHFGRTSLFNAGLRRFKLGWGTAEELIKYFQWDTTGAKWMHGQDHGWRMHNTLFAHMPLALNRLGGALLYPHLD